MKNYKLLLTIILLSPCVLFAQKAKDISKFQTHFEKNGYNRTPRYDQTIDYCKLLADNSPYITLSSIGKSAQGRDIPLLIADNKGYTTAEQVRKDGKTLVLIQACIHAGEPDGKDAGLMLLRDMILFGRNLELLNNVTILFIPIFNTDGHEDFTEFNRINQNGPIELGARATAQRINLNRDFVKADSPEMKSWLKFYTQWDPELFIDVHVTNGADFQYVITYATEDAGFIDGRLKGWAKTVFEPQLNRYMEKTDYQIFPYFSFKEYGKPEKGFTIDPFPPQYSNGYASSKNRIGLLLENHIYKPYKDRVYATYYLLESAIKIMNKNGASLRKTIDSIDAQARKGAFINTSLPLAYKDNFKDSILVDYKGWKAETIKSDLSGADMVVQNYNSPVTIKSHIYTSFEPTSSIVIPESYIISAENGWITNLLDYHGIEYRYTSQDSIFNVETYRFTPKSEWNTKSYEGRITLKPDYTTQNESVLYPKNSIIISNKQPLYKITAFMLEPKSPTSLAYWGYFNNYVKPASEFYVSIRYMEVKGREMLANDPLIKEEFEAKKQSDPSFANDPNAILNFFMKKVRANVETNANLYPIGRLWNNQ